MEMNSGRRRSELRGSDAGMQISGSQGKRSGQRK